MTTKLVDKEMEVREKQAAELIATLTDGDNSYVKVTERIKALEGAFTEMKGLNHKNVREELDKIKAKQESTIEAIRSSKRGVYIPGLEDTGKKFSLLRAMNAVKRQNWTGAEYEKEIMDLARQKSAQQIGQDSLGGFWVPDNVIPDVIEAIYTRSVFVNLLGEEGETSISVYDGLVGGNVKIPRFDGGMIAYWIGEEDKYVETQARVGDVTMNPKKLGLLIRLTDAFKRFTGMGLEARLRKDMARAMAKKLDWTILYGTGTNDMPKGILLNTGIKYFRAQDGVTMDFATMQAYSGSWAGGELDFDKLMDMQLALEEDDISLDESAKVISSPRYFTRLKKLKILNFSGQTSGQPYLLGAPMLSDSKLRDIIGNYGKSNQISSIQKAGASVGGIATGAGLDAKHTTVVYGNLNEIVLGRWGALEIEDDMGKGLGFTSDHTYIKMRMYADLVVRQERAIIVSPDVRVRD